VRIGVKQRLHFLAAPEEGNGFASNRNQSPCPRISSGPAFPVTGGVDPRIDGEGCSGDDKGAVEAAGLFTGMAIQSDGLSVVSSV
jgi:hypothetical protein